MKALVLTFDKYRDLTNHMIFQYEKLWPNHPFQFYIPYQKFNGENTTKKKYISCDANIKKTVLNLVRNIDENEWVYWCIDDKYPIKLKLEKIIHVYNWINSIESSRASGILFCRCRKLLIDDYLTNEKITDPRGNIYLRRNSFEQIWIHQFLRVKVIKYLFNLFPETIKNAKEMDSYKSNIPLPNDYRLYVTEKNLAVFGESTSRGKITQNCMESIVNNNLEIPSWHQHNSNIIKIMGTLEDKEKSFNLIFYAKNRLLKLFSSIKKFSIFKD